MTDRLLAAGRHFKAVRIWLYVVAALVFAIVIVGGATRLTESGLSIVEWKPVTGTVPPLSLAEWRAEFDKYKTIPQYEQMNRGMSLEQFKTIYWWEWTHRLLGRVIGVAFLLPFLWFLGRGWLDRGTGWRLGLIFGLGVSQGVVGWWMVASGLTDRVEVSEYRLATHLLLASVIYVAIIWTAGRIDLHQAGETCSRLRVAAVGLVLLVLLQIFVGALLAGLRGGLMYNTWPLMDGRFMPERSQLFFLEPVWRNFFENIPTVQFMHRMIAYGLWIASALFLVATGRTNSGQIYRRALLLFLAVSGQVVLGIFTLLHLATILIALAHQAMAMVALTLAVTCAGRKAVTRQAAVGGLLANSA